MKYTLAILLVFTLVGQSIAQTIYESAHVKDGKTIQFDVPTGYSELVELVPGHMIYSSNKDIDPNEMDLSDLNAGILMFMHIPKDSETLESLKEELEEQLTEKEMTVIGAPEIVNVKGKDCFYAGVDGDFIEEGVSRVYFGVIEFGDYFILVNYFSPEAFTDDLKYKEFKKILANYEVVTTDKVDGMDEVMSDEMEDYSIYFKNDLFETDLEYYDVLPDLVEDWYDDIDESGHLLSMFSYKFDRGFIKVFSGGSTSNYPSDEEKARAIEKAMEWNKTMTLTFNSQFSNEDHFFKLYSISGGGTMTSVYTTIVNSELVFFVVDGGINPDEGFKPAVRDFMLTMWIDYFDEEVPIDEE